MNISSNGHSFIFWPHFMLETQSLPALTDPCNACSCCLVQLGAARKSSEPCTNKTCPESNVIITTLESWLRESVRLLQSHTVPCSLSATWSLQAWGVPQRWCQQCQTQPSLYTCQQMVFHQHTSGQLSSAFTGGKNFSAGRVSFEKSLKTKCSDLENLTLLEEIEKEKQVCNRCHIYPPI